MHLRETLVYEIIPINSKKMFYQTGNILPFCNSS